MNPKFNVERDEGKLFTRPIGWVFYPTGSTFISGVQRYKSSHKLARPHGPNLSDTGRAETKPKGMIALTIYQIQQHSTSIWLSCCHIGIFEGGFSAGITSVTSSYSIMVSS